jgi:hypothetical protein
MGKDALVVLCRATAEEFEHLARLYRARADFLEAYAALLDNVVRFPRPPDDRRP